MVVSVTDALPGLSGLLWEGWVGVQHVCGISVPNIALAAVVGDADAREREELVAIDGVEHGSCELRAHLTPLIAVW